MPGGGQALRGDRLSERDLREESREFLDLLPAAETFTGWRQEEARARAIHEVFRVADEESGQPVEARSRTC